MVFAFAPQTPVFGSSPNGFTTHGPMLQFLQQMPSLPYPHCGCCFSRRSHAVSMPCSLVLSISFFVAGSGPTLSIGIIDLLRLGVDVNALLASLRFLDVSLTINYKKRRQNRQSLSGPSASPIAIR